MATPNFLRFANKSILAGHLLEYHSSLKLLLKFSIVFLLCNLHLGGYIAATCTIRSLLNHGLHYYIVLNVVAVHKKIVF